MKLLAIIFKKELRDMLRDRRTLFFMIVMPFLIIFLIFNLSMRLGMDMEKRAQEKELRVAVFSAEPLPDFSKLLLGSEKVKIDTTVDKKEIDESVRNGRLDFAVSFAADFAETVDRDGTGDVQVYYKASTSENELAMERIRKVMEKYKQQLLERRLFRQRPQDALWPSGGARRIKHRGADAFVRYWRPGQPACRLPEADDALALGCAVGDDAEFDVRALPERLARDIEFCD